jgi:hypothetical protein
MYDWLIKVEAQLSKDELTELLRNIQANFVSAFVGNNPARKYEINFVWTAKIEKIQYFRLAAEISYAFTNGDAATNSVPVPIVPIPPPPKIPKGVDIINLKEPEIKASVSHIIDQGFASAGLPLLYQGRLE